GVTGGHPKAGETCIEGIISEVKEELGYDISKCKLTEFEHGCDGKDCYRMYYTKLDVNIKDLVIQEEELTELKWFSITQLEKMVQSKNLNQDQVDFFLKCTEFINKQ
ncbi:MAG: NUDIX domain-containing protein, partial [Bacilli bacterium]